ALAVLWDVDDDKLLDLLTMEEKLTTVDSIVQQIARNYKSYFGGTYIDIKAEKVYVNTVNSSATSIITNSPSIIRNNYTDFIEFKPANNSLTILTDRFDEIYVLVKRFKPDNQDFIRVASKYHPTLIVPDKPVPHPSCSNNAKDNRILNRDLIKRKILYGE
ncbi:26455_t:CDS:2, partial [Racocetra persica]